MLGLEGKRRGATVQPSAVALPGGELARTRWRPLRLGFEWGRTAELAIGIAAVVAAIVAVWMTLRADFLAYPGWLAVQKADLIVGPVLGGLYWLRRRPRSRFGPVMIAVGFLSVPYILQSSAARSSTTTSNCSRASRAVSGTRWRSRRSASAAPGRQGSMSCGRR